MAYDIIVLAGQSNAEGTGLGNGPMFEENERILQLYDPQDNGFEESANGEMLLKVKRPWHFLIAPAKERRKDGHVYGNFALWFAKRYIDSGLLKKNRKILIVNAAVGGTGFKKRHWGRGDVLSDRLYEMTDVATSAKGSKIVAFLWHQGEHDAFENEGSDSELYEEYYQNLLSFFTDVQNKYSAYSFPIIAGGFVDEYVKNNPGCLAVFRATQAVSQTLKNVAVVSGEGLQSNNQAVGNGDDAHFCREALYELGQRYFEKYRQMTNT